MAARNAWLGFAVVAAALSLGCASAQGVQPLPPSGVTYVYDYQGFKEQGTTALGGVVPIAPHAGVAYGGAFSFREGREIRVEGFSDPLAEATPIDGVRFNTHLEGQGAPLAPRVAASASSALPPASPPPR